MGLERHDAALAGTAHDSRLRPRTQRGQPCLTGGQIRVERSDRVPYTQYLSVVFL
jgi:hypothetical protein